MMQMTEATFQVKVNLIHQATDPISHTPVSNYLTPPYHHLSSTKFYGRLLFSL